MVLSRALGLSQSLMFPTECAGNEGVRAQRRGASRTSRAMWDLSSVAPPPPCPPHQMPRTPAEVPATGVMGKETEGRAEAGAGQGALMGQQV